MILLHVIAHGYSVEPKGLHLVLSDSLKPSARGLTGLPAEDLLKPLAALASTSVLMVDACQAGAVTRVPLGERQCLVASTGPSEQASRLRLHRGLAQGHAGPCGRQPRRTGGRPLREVFDWVAAEVAPGQTPVLREGRPGLAARIVLGVHAQELVGKIPPCGKPLPAPGLTRNSCRMVPASCPWMGNRSGRSSTRSTCSWAPARPPCARSGCRTGKTPGGPRPGDECPGGTVQRAAVFQPVPAARQESILPHSGQRRRRRHSPAWRPLAIPPCPRACRRRGF